MLELKQPLTPVTFDPDEEWQVVVDDKVFLLNGKEASVIKEATIKGQRGLIWFKDKAISIPYISSMFRVKSAKKAQQSEPVEAISDEQREINLQTLRKMREKYNL